MSLKQAVGVVLEIGRLDERRPQPQAVGIGAHAVAFLDGIAAAERGPAAAVHQLAADIEVLLEHEDGRPEIARPHGGMQADASRPEDDDVGLVVPGDALRGASPGADRTAALMPAAAPLLKKSRRLNASFGLRGLRPVSPFLAMSFAPYELCCSAASRS